MADITDTDVVDPNAEAPMDEMSRVSQAHDLYKRISDALPRLQQEASETGDFSKLQVAHDQLQRLDGVANDFLQKRGIAPPLPIDIKNEQQLPGVNESQKAPDQPSTGTSGGVKEFPAPVASVDTRPELYETGAYRSGAKQIPMALLRPPAALQPERPPVASVDTRPVSPEKKDAIKAILDWAKNKDEIQQNVPAQDMPDQPSVGTSGGVKEFAAPEAQPINPPYEDHTKAQDTSETLPEKMDPEYLKKRAAYVAAQNVASPEDVNNKFRMDASKKLYNALQDIADNNEKYSLLTPDFLSRTPAILGLGDRIKRVNEQTDAIRNAAKNDPKGLLEIVDKYGLDKDLDIHIAAAELSKLMPAETTAEGAPAEGAPAEAPTRTVSKPAVSTYQAKTVGGNVAPAVKPAAATTDNTPSIPKEVDPNTPPGTGVDNNGGIVPTGQYIMNKLGNDPVALYKNIRAAMDAQGASPFDKKAFDARVQAIIGERPHPTAWNVVSAFFAGLGRSPEAMKMANQWHDEAMRWDATKADLAKELASKEDQNTANAISLTSHAMASQMQANALAATNARFNVGQENKAAQFAAGQENQAARQQNTLAESENRLQEIQKNTNTRQDKMLALQAEWHKVQEDLANRRIDQQTYRNIINGIGQAVRAVSLPYMMRGFMDQGGKVLKEAAEVGGVARGEAAAREALNIQGLQEATRNAWYEQFMKKPSLYSGEMLRQSQQNLNRGGKPGEGFINPGFYEPPK